MVRNYQTLLVWLLGGKTMAESVKLRVEVVDDVGQDREALRMRGLSLNASLSAIVEWVTYASLAACAFRLASI